MQFSIPHEASQQTLLTFLENFNEFSIFILQSFQYEFIVLIISLTVQF